MSYLQKLGALSMLSSSIIADNKFNFVRVLYWQIGFSPVASGPRFYRTKKAPQTDECGNSGEMLNMGSRNGHRISRATRKEAQAALLEYLHSTRGIQLMDAENMSKNSPIFLGKLLGRVEHEGDIGRSITRFLRYHPINEFEPFFESVGLQPAEYDGFLPRNLMFLSDDDLLLENYHVLCNYGIERNKIGKIYKEATQIFQYDYGVLLSKLKAYEKLGIGQATVVKFVVCSPYLLVGGVDDGFVQVLDKLKNIGFESSWVEEQLTDCNSYNWKKILGLLFRFEQMGCSDEKLADLISQHPDFLFEDSGSKSLSLIGLLLKMGCSMIQICSVLLQFPQIRVGKFVSNMRLCLLFFNEIDMGVQEIGCLFRSHPLLLGLCTLKKASSLLHLLNVGKKRLCQFILENPEELKNWKLGTKVSPLPNSGEIVRSKQQKTQFLLKLGLEENSTKMEEALQAFQGKGTELQERFDCIVEAGIDEKDVYKMIEVSPRILNQTKDMLEEKIDFFLNNLGYPVSSLISFPSYLCYATQRVTLRIAMCNWLKEQGIVLPMLALRTILVCSDDTFLRRYVNHHPRGTEVWENLKREIYSDSMTSLAY
ncbi:transcription termination factor MTEF18, mitochondrial-like [Benincasa hispida]|uniref:transcription termination factor MTEF18, mitochondrial-like n=1 Tax=Benincasa hispida TaxID=102211 RepID=UPI001901898E|nr:transcription termination factor MTEF18, mitochondrial-like [Benincasa hispida]